MSFADLRAFFHDRDIADGPVAEDMRSTLLEGTGDTAIVLLHGLTASPLAWSSIAGRLHAQGATVVAVRLPLHGYRDRMTRALEGLTADVLTTDLKTVIAAVARHVPRVIVGGHSIGGTLAIHAAATFAAVDRIVAIAPFLGIASLPHEVHPTMIPLIEKLPNLFLWWDPVERERQMPAHGYPRYPLHALAAGLRIADAVYADAEQAPRARAIDLVINSGESSVNNRAVMRLAKRWRAASGAVAVHRLEGLPPSHDIIEPLRSSSGRAELVLVKLLLAGSDLNDAVHSV